MWYKKRKKRTNKRRTIGTGLWERKDTDGYGANDLEDLKKQHAKDQKRKKARRMKKLRKQIHRERKMM